MNIIWGYDMSEKMSLKELLQTQEYKESNTVLPIILGVDTQNKVTIEDLRDVFSILIGGNSGSGKTTLINTLLTSLTTKLSEKECKIAIFSSKSGDFKQWNNDKHVFIQSGTNDCVAHFNSILKIIDDRSRILSENNASNAMAYRNKTHNSDMPCIVVIMDDLSDFIQCSDNDTRNFIKTICAKSNMVDIYVITATNQYDLLDDITKAHFITRIAFKTNNYTESVAILEESGAESLSKGDVLYSCGGRIPLKIHTTK